MKKNLIIFLILLSFESCKKETFYDFNYIIINSSSQKIELEYKKTNAITTEIRVVKPNEKIVFNYNYKLITENLSNVFETEIITLKTEDNRRLVYTNCLTRNCNMEERNIFNKNSYKTNEINSKSMEFVFTLLNEDLKLAK